MAEERQTGYTIAETVELPSKGQIYDPPISPNIELRSMTARDEMKRLSPSITPLKTLADIIEGCMVEKPKIHVYDMHLGDFEFLLHKLRIVTYGDKYKVTLRCTDCGEIINVETSLNDLEVRPFDYEEYHKLQDFVLPKSGKHVVLKNISPNMNETVAAVARDKKKRHSSVTLDFETLVRLTAAIDTIDDTRYNATELESIITNLPAIDMQKIINNIEKIAIAIGVDTRVFITCPNCGNEIETFFRFGPEFFRPTNI